MGELALVGDHSKVPLTRISCNTVFSKSQNAHKGHSVGIQTLILPAPFFRIFLHCADTHESLKHHNPLALFIITWVFSPGNVHCAGASQNTVIQNQYSYLENKLFLDTKIHILTFFNDRLQSKSCIFWVLKTNHIYLQTHGHYSFYTKILLYVVSPYGHYYYVITLTTYFRDS